MNYTREETQAVADFSTGEYCVVDTREWVEISIQPSDGYQMCKDKLFDLALDNTVVVAAMAITLSIFQLSVFFGSLWLVCCVTKPEQYNL